MDNKIIFDNVRYCYEDVCALHGASFYVKENSLTAIVGPNGGGKSTILKIAAGLLKPDAGSVSLDSEESIGYVAQDFGIDLSFPITVKEIVLSGTLNNRIKPFAKYSPMQKMKMEKALSKVGLEGFEDRGVNQLSGGQAKRAVIARALASDAEIIILDEPDSSLDIDAAKTLFKILNAIKGDKTILVASHSIDDILDVADSALYVNGTAQSYLEPLKLKEKLKEGIMI